MNYLKIIAYIGASAIIGWVAFFAVTFKLEAGSSLGVLLFYVSFFMAVASTCALIGFFLRKTFIKGELLYDQLNVSIRQGILLSLISIACLFFKHLGVLTWWVAILLIGLAVMIEFYLVAKE